MSTLLRIFSFLLLISIINCSKKKQNNNDINHSVFSAIKSHNQSTIKNKKNVGNIHDIKVLNSGTDESNLILEWTSNDIKDIAGTFDILRKFGDNAYRRIAKTKLYEGKGNIEKFRWKEHDPTLGSYTNMVFEKEGKLPLKNYFFQVQFNPSDKEKYQAAISSKETQGYLLPRNEEMAMLDIIANLQYAYTEDCGFFSHFALSNNFISRKGNFSGIYKREINFNSNKIIYSFENYSHFGAIAINGNLIADLIPYKSENTSMIQPTKISGNLKIDGIYRAKIVVNNLVFEDECAHQVKNGLVTIKYNHPNHGEMNTQFTSMFIPKNFLTFKKN